LVGYSSPRGNLFSPVPFGSMLSSARGDRKVHLAEGRHIAAAQEVDAKVRAWCQKRKRLVCLVGVQVAPPNCLRTTRLICPTGCLANSLSSHSLLGEWIASLALAVTVLGPSPLFDR
jgi:hypothetical protein